MRWGLVAMLTLVLAAPSVAAAGAPTGTQRRGARITWARGAGAEVCVGQVGLEEDVKARLGFDPFALPRDLGVEGVIVRQPRGFHAELVIRDASDRVLGTRQLSSPEPDCRSLGQAVAVTITVAIDPDASGETPTTVEDVTAQSPRAASSEAQSFDPSRRPDAHERERAGAGAT